MLNLKYWRQDALSSLVVFLVALPLCLGIALASNAPLASGLLAGMVGGIVVGFISGSNVSVSGPAAGLTVIVARSIADLGSFEAFTLCVFVSGILQIIFAAVRGGVIGNYFPTSVIKGMLAAIGLILILKQFPHAVGYDADFMGDEAFSQADGQNTFSEIEIALRSVHYGSIFVALVSLAIMLGWDTALVRRRRYLSLVPGALIAVVASIILNEVFKGFFPFWTIEEKHLVQIPFDDGFRDFFAGLSLPDWSHLGNFKIYTTALTIALVGSLESLLSIDAADKIDQDARVTPKNRELLAQGCGNALSGFIGGLPLTAVIVRTSANASAGGRTKLSAILHGVWLLLCVVTIPHVLNLIPLSCLAAVLILVGYKLTRPALIRQMYAKGWNQFIPFVTTVVAILFTDLLTGIFIGMLVGFYYVIKSNMHKAIVMVNDEKNYLIRFHKDVSFMQKRSMLELLDAIPDGAYLVIDGSTGVFIDDDINEIIVDFLKRAPSREITVELMKSSLSLSPLFKEVAHG